MTSCIRHLNSTAAERILLTSTMKRAPVWAWLLAVWAWLGCSQAVAQLTNRTLYSLVEGSFLIDDCLICGRPTIMKPLGGPFELVRAQLSPPYSKYLIRDVKFVAGAGTSLERRITGSGTYVRFEEFALLQDMDLAVDIKDNFTNRPAFFTNESRTVSQPFPLIQVNLKQTNGTLMQTFSLQLFAAPVREIWFSTTRGFTSTNRSAPTNQITAGDLLSNRGRVVKRNIDLVGRLGVMPIVYDLGLDAVQVSRRGEILFSLPKNVFSETLGNIQHGDLLSSRGAIVRRNQELLAAVHPVNTADAGLDGFRILPNGEILFSIQSNVVTAAGTTLTRGSILSDQGRIFLSQWQLMMNFRPSVTNYDFGLDAFHILPSGEIWFSVEEGFLDARLGQIQAGDLLSNFGYRVFSNADLLAAFAPADTSVDYGLDALYVVTDTVPPKATPRIIQQTRNAGGMHLEWDGVGEVFQLEHALDLQGPWVSCSPILPEISGDAACNVSAESAGFFRLRQW